ncbi:hypothetical protein [Caballeronia novacaledonica]|uniref:Uncharacterized protein n=1 Tax=Caballeronia novacaledonica TaxID=1544861 RepID=A0AA37MUL6_9BURK|nr:hypothetical protein [Caballeronia novacaledonica]GJH29294.1 hypothetical protein CBA19CS42_32280 [Caballeronia novacaledonica]
MTDLDDWPKTLRLTSAQVDSFLPEASADEIGRVRQWWEELFFPESKSVKWFTEWLALTQHEQSKHPEQPEKTELPKHFDPGPYQQVINFLQKTGDTSGLDTIYIRSKNEERHQACKDSNILTFPGCVYLSAAFLVGYGRRLVIAVIASILFVVFGAYVFRKQEKPKFKKKFIAPTVTDSVSPATHTPSDEYVPLRWAYSFDMFIPLIKLRDKHYNDVDFTGKIRFYLYAHKLAGWILGTFIVASIVSLTK